MPHFHGRVDLPKKKRHLESGLNQRGQATAGFIRVRSHRKRSKIFYWRGFAVSSRFVGCTGTARAGLCLIHHHHQTETPSALGGPPVHPHEPYRKSRALHRRASPPPPPPLPPPPPPPRWQCDVAPRRALNRESSGSPMPDARRLPGETTTTSTTTATRRHGDLEAPATSGRGASSGPAGAPPFALRSRAQSW